MSGTLPIVKLDDLWTWDESSVPHYLVGDSLKNYSRHRGHPETLLCHDMKGGYLEEEKVDGSEIMESSSPFTLFHWWYVDIFVYFSHNFITIPPVGWINQAHMHGVIVLGTLITEHVGGADLCKKFLKSEDCVMKTVQKLVDIAVKYNFEGWLINIENEIKSDCLPHLELFLMKLTERMRSAIGEQSRVIWYDAVTVDGELKWQNELNDKNQKWFDITNGIFLNYTWKVKQLCESSIRAKYRCRDIFVGVDCFGRGCHGGGGWNSHEAFMYPRQYNLSVALFAPGWIAETLPHRDLIVNSFRFWDRLIAFVWPHPLSTLPIETDFNHGYRQEKNSKYYTLTAAKLQPHYLASGVFPKVGGTHIILPGPALYRLFTTNLLLNGIYRVVADSSSKLQLVIWKNKCCDENENEMVQIENEDAEGIWNFRVENERIVGIGVISSDSAVLRSFAFRRITATS